MVNTLDRYLFREIFQPFVRTILFLTVLMIFGQMLKLADQFSALGLSAGAIAKAICYSFAPSMGMILPLSLLVATILSYSRLAADGELTAFSAAGFPFSRLLVTPFLFGILVSICSMAFSVYGEPWGIKSLQKLLSEAVKESLTKELQPATFYNWLPGVMVYAEDRQPDHTLDNLLFLDGRNSNAVMMVSARNGRLIPLDDSSSILFHLNDGDVFFYRERELTKIAFKSNDYRLDLGKLSASGEGLFVARQGMYLDELLREAENPEATDRQRCSYKTAFHKKIALPLAAIIFSLLGALLASGRSKNSLAAGLIIGVAVIGVYYYVMRTGELAAIRGNMTAWLAMWLPNMIFGAFTIIYALIKTLRLKG